MKNILFLITCCLSASFVVLGCKESSTPGSTSETEPDYLVPLHIGNRWTFRITSFTPRGATSWVGTSSAHIGSDTTVNGVKWCTYVFEGPSTGPLGYRNDEHGFYVTNWQFASFSYPYPAQRGDSIPYGKVISTDTLLLTSLGQIKCYLYQIDWFGFPMNTFIAPHIGILRQESPGLPAGSTTPYLSQTTDMIDYKLY